MKNERKLLIVGAGGMLGTALKHVAPSKGYGVEGPTEAELDIVDSAAVEVAVADFAARAAETGAKAALVNAAAYTDVERAEDDAERAFLVNDQAAGWLASTASRHGLPFAHVSTDFVFDGTKNAPYAETDEPRPLNVYGLSKLAGERAVEASHPEALIVRTAWTFGRGGSNFPDKILRRAAAILENQSGQSGLEKADGADTALRVVADEVGSPTYSLFFAEGLLDLLSAGARGLYHLAGSGACSRYELALATLRLAGYTVPGHFAVDPAASGSCSSKARRPLTCVLDCSKAARMGVRLPPWQDGLARYMAER